MVHLSWQAYLARENPPGTRFEYDDGRLLVSPTGTNAHNLLIRLLAADFERYEAETEDGVCLTFTEHSFFMPAGRRDLQPDLGVVTDERKSAPIPPDGRMEGAPNIAVEVLSPSTERRDRTLKAKRYFEGGTSEYWLFNPLQETAEFLRRGSSGWEVALRTDAAYRTPLLPGFALDVDALWRRLRKKLRRR
jgi:Uma2 family endonuclease